MRTEGFFMELSPKQQAINQIKKANRVLILGNNTPDGDSLGSLLALFLALQKLGKNVEAVSYSEINEIYNFLPSVKEIQTELEYSNDKIIKIDTNKIPVKGMKWQKEDGFLNIYLESEKNLKFEFIEIDNGQTKPELIIVLNSPDLDKIDSFYEKNTELFYEVPIINIDHRPGNEYFGTINLVDLTATSTSEILVSLFEALGLKLDDQDIATNLLAGIIYNTQSFRNQSTTPKSLTVAAQLLAAGARQQEIIANFYKKKPIELLKAWGEMLRNTKKEKAHNFAWTKIEIPENQNINKDDVFSVAEDLQANTPEADVFLVICKDREIPGTIFAKLKASKEQNIQDIAKEFNGEGTAFDAHFQVKEDDLDVAEKIILKKIADLWQKKENTTDSSLWSVIDQSPDIPVDQSVLQEKKTQEDPKTNNGDINRIRKEKKDAIDEAIRSISQLEDTRDKKSFEHIGEVISRRNRNEASTTKQSREDEEIDVFDDGE